MPIANLTDAAVQRFNAPAGERIEYFDKKLPGFALRVSGPTPRNPIGSKTWVLLYRLGTAKKRLTIEPGYPAQGLAEARRKARAALLLVAEQKDPIEINRERERQVRRQALTTIESVIDEFMVRYLVAQRRAPRYIAETRRNFDLHVLPVWRGRPIASIKRRDILELLDGIVDRGTPIAANRVLASINKLFNWAADRELIEISPVLRIQKPAAERKRTRVLTDAEIRLVWKAMALLPYPKGPYLRLIFVTAQRREETATVRWSDIHADETWIIPPEANKPDRTHVVPLSALALSILRDCPKVGKHVFTTRRKRGASADAMDADAPLSGYSDAKEELDHVVADLAASAGVSAPEPWTIHDLRRTATTIMGKLGMSRFIQKRILNHADGEVTGIYDRYEYLPEKRDALEKWAGYLEGLSCERPL